MKQFLLSISALAMIAGSVFADDCNCPKCQAARQAACRPGVLARLFGGPATGGLNSRRAFVSSEYQGPPMQQLPAVAYPYYTTRGPRDFLAKEPYGIGP
jgi:hypothetical protein